MSAKVESVLHPFSSDIATPAPYLQTVEPLLLLLMMFPVLSARIPWVLSSTVQLGYFFAQDSVLGSIFDIWLTDLARYLGTMVPGMDCIPNYSEWKLTISSIEPSLCP